jgi:integrase
MYLLYKENRPTVDPESRFYLQVNRYWQTKGNWFNTCPMGKDSLGTIAKALSESADFSGKHTNHSGRKTFISNLLDKGVPPREVAQISGHKNLQSLNHYHSLSIERQQELSEILHAPQKKDTPGTSETNFRTDEISDSELVN